ncbi:MAG: MMPL family transporter [Actinobacteria bacterium]|nr:MMPL family transporter [Actinomycetota bacterium]
MNTASLAHRTGRARKGLWIAIIVVFGWLAIGGISGPVFSKISTVQENDNSAFLPESAESTIASKITVKFSNQSADLLPTLLLAVGNVSPQSNPQVFAKLNSYASALGEKILPESKKPLREYFIAGAPLQAIPSADGKAVLINVQLNSKIAGENVNDEPILPLIIDFIREDLEKNFGGDSIETHVTGPGGIFADLFGAFGSIDTRLLSTTLIVVAIILIIVYRSPFLWIIPLFTAALALAFATMIVYYLAKADIIDLNGQTQGILDVLVLGAATDYALLLISRYREELHLQRSRFTAMRVALRGVVEPILASGSTVIAGLMVLLLSDLSSNRGLGPVGSIGIACAMFAALTLLPAALVLVGRWVFWPKKPKFDSEDEKLSGLWSKVGNLVDRKPKPVWISTAVLLVIFAGFSITLKSDGLAQTDAFTTRPDSVIGLEKLGEHFPSGEGTPVEIVVRESDLQQSIAAISQVKNVASVVPVTNFDMATMTPTKDVKVVDGNILLYATLSVAADSTEAKNTIPLIREAAKSVNERSLVGGQTAIGYDVDQSSKRDNRVIIPIVLILIALILGLLLRSILASVLLLVTVVLSFFATLGVCALVFEYVFGFKGTDASFPLFAFVFLVALGIDYNIFLMTRVREEAQKIGTKAGVIRGLTVTGGVITSAGIVLAATFGVLGVLPLVFLAQLGFAVAFGVLLDTIVVRSLLVPALVRILGKKIWWPSKLSKVGID